MTFVFVPSYEDAQSLRNGSCRSSGLVKLVLVLLVAYYKSATDEKSS